MDEQSAIQMLLMLLDDLHRDIISQKESLKMISQNCSDKTTQRQLHVVMGSQEHCTEKIRKHLDMEKEG